MEKLRLIVLLGILLNSISYAKACNNILGIQREAIDANHVVDVLIVKVDIPRNCLVAVKRTYYKWQWLQLIGTTDRKKVTDRNYSRRLKVKVKKVCKENIIGFDPNQG